MTFKVTILSLVLFLSSALSFAAPQQNTSEEALYVEVIKSFRLRNQLALKKNVDLILQKYPTSSFADNALFLKGQLYMQNRLFAEAIKEFQALGERYPRSNKAVSALFAKGQAYRKLSLYEHAEKAFKQIKKNYPGSPEAERCDLELKLVEVQKAG